MQSPLPGRNYGDKDWILNKSSRQPNFLHIMTLFGTDLGDRSWLFPFHTSGKVALVVKNPPTNAGDIREAGSIPGLGRSPGGGNVNPLQYLPRESHEHRSLAGYGPYGHKECTRCHTQAQLKPRGKMNSPRTQTINKWWSQGRNPSQLFIKTITCLMV